MNSPRGRFGLGPYQGNGAEYGYRLIYNQNRDEGQTALELIRLTRNGSKTLDTYGKQLVLEDGQPHKLLWTRKPSGIMVVSLDGKRVMSVQDTAFRESFAGLVVANGGGDFALRHITVKGEN